MTLGSLYIEAQGYVPVLLENLHGMSCSGTCWPLGGMEAVVGVASATIPAVKDLATVVILGITPFNVVKGILVSVTGYTVFKAVRNVLQNESR